jgi:galactokinase
VPIGAGLSSSAAVEVAFAVLWRALGGWEMDAMRLAQACQQAEVEYVGLNCGLMDQFASAHGRAGQALFLDCRTLEWQPVPLPAETSIVVADTKVRRSLAQSEYNVRHAQCREAVRLLAERLPGIRALRDVTPEQFVRHGGVLPEVVRRRAQHIVEECDRVLKSVEWLRTGDAASFGQAMFEGHASLRDLYEVSCPELNAMVEAARPIEGCYGARLTGAGFGGCAVALVARPASAASWPPATSRPPASSRTFTFAALQMERRWAKSSHNTFQIGPVRALRVRRGPHTCPGAPRPHRAVGPEGDAREPPAPSRGTMGERQHGS